MALKGFTASTDFAPSKRLNSIILSQGVGAQTVNLRDGGSGGAIMAQLQVAAASSQVTSFSRPILFPSGLYVQVVGTGFAQGTVDLD